MKKITYVNELFQVLVIGVKTLSIVLAVSCVLLTNSLPGSIRGGTFTDLKKVYLKMDRITRPMLIERVY